jgi:DNA repair exonuclease SbcCD nuclease subunit
MVEKIAHLSDLHIHRSQLRHDEYRKIFNDLYKILSSKKPDRIVIVGDLYHDFVDLSNEAQLLMASFLNNLARISHVVITRGNHDLMKKNLSRIDTVETITKMINNPNITYYNQTGFYEDDNVVWAVWNHRDMKYKNPWIEIPHSKIKGKTYIDLFHDPVQSCLSHNGFPMTKGNYVSLDSFKGAYTFLGDIHLYQTFGKNKNIAYSSSLIQQNFGELPHSHGFIMWDIKNGTHEFIEMPNEHVFINFEVKENTDYENLNLTSPYIKSQPEIKVKWSDISSQINKSNEIKIRQYIKDKYKIDKIRIEKNPIYTDITDIKFVNEGIDINNQETQRTIFEEYLKLNKYDEEFIKEVLKIDDIINSRLQIKDVTNGVEWKIEKFWFDNFKSYGDGNIIDWNGVNGIIQIHGENQQGKTTILDAICYILYGKTLSTLKAEKNGDNRYINNKRDLDECSGGAVLNINGDLYTITRKSVRKWNRDKSEISGVKTDLVFYSGTELIEENKLVGETLKKTQPIIEDALGDFTTFVRLVLTTADNLNDLISMDRSVFIDSIIRDAGYDIFEIKLKEYKDYIKELNEERININPIEEKEKITKLNVEIRTLNESLNTILENIEKKKEEEILERERKENEIKKLHKIDDSLVEINISDLEQNIKNNKEKIVSNKDEIERLKKLNESLPETFDYETFNLNKKTYDTDNTTANNLRVEISELNGVISKKESEISQSSDKSKNIITNKINSLKNVITIKNNDCENKKKDVVQLIKDHLSALKDEVQNNKTFLENLKTKQESIKENATELKTQISDISESKTCTLCGTVLTADNVSHVREHIATIKAKLSNLQDDYKKLDEEKKPHQEKINNILEKSEKIKNKNFEDEPELKKKYDEAVLQIKDTQTVITETENDIKLLEEGNYEKFSDVTSLIDNIVKTKKETEKTLEQDKKNRETKLSEYNVLAEKNKKLKESLDYLEIDKLNFENRKENNNTVEKLTLENDNLDLKIKNDELTKEKINSQSDKVDENKRTQLLINTIQANIETITTTIETHNTEREEINNSILLKNKDIELINKNLEDYNKQENRNEIRKVYMQSIHRDGLPTYLLKKSIHLINQELSNLLSNVDFSIYFDDELNLKLSSDNRLDVNQNVIESSGKERTFSALALKVALRKINKKSKCDLLLLDEIMIKLLNKSVDEFIEFLDDVSKEIGKLIIIEHIHTVNYDAKIDVKKDEYGVSSLTFEY